MSKFEYLIGTESDFNGAVCDCTLKIRHDFLGLMFCTESTIPRRSGVSIIAMRRIIREPKRWTVEDQKAGLLPEVGCSVYSDLDKQPATVLCVDNESDIWFQCESGRVRCTDSYEISPIETPEEKAERLRSEWINEAINAVRKTDVNGYESIYDALLSGALSVPTKGGE